MIIEISSHRFPGFYESIFNGADDFFDDEYELQADLLEIVDDEKLEVCYEYENFDLYKKDVSKKYLEYYVDKLIEILPPDIYEHNDFKFEIIEGENNVTVVSPKYYNYSTDRCYCLVETNIQTLEMLKDFGLKHEDVQKYLIDNFTSYDGYISFVKNDIEYWKTLSIEEYVEEERYIIALLDMIIYMNDLNAFEEIKLATYYDIDKYYYAEPIVYCTEKSKEILLDKYSPNLKIKTVR